jgi:hypothetical protein
MEWLRPFLADMPEQDSPLFNRGLSLGKERLVEQPSRCTDFLLTPFVFLGSGEYKMKGSSRNVNHAWYGWDDKICTRACEQLCEYIH